MEGRKERRGLGQRGATRSQGMANDEEAAKRKQEEEEEEGGGGVGDPIDVFPRARVRKIMRIDPEIHKMTSEALTLVSLSTSLFLRHLADISADETLRRRKRIVRAEHLREAVRGHRPTSDFLLDCLPPPAAPAPPERPKDRSRPAEKPVQAETRRIDDFFRRE